MARYKIYYLTTNNKIYKDTVLSKDALEVCIKHYEEMKFKWSYNRKDLVKKLKAIRKEQKIAWKKIKKWLCEKINF